MKFPVYVVDIIEDVLANVILETGLNINYVYGQSIDILKNLKQKDESTTLQATKYPLFALYMPFKEKRGGALYADVTFPKIVIAYLTNAADTVNDRYEDVFKPFLYPVYTSFLKYLAQSEYVTCKDPDAIQHTKEDFPAIGKVQGTEDFVDTIQISDLFISINQIKTC